MWTKKASQYNCCGNEKFETIIHNLNNICSSSSFLSLRILCLPKKISRRLFSALRRWCLNKYPCSFILTGFILQTAVAQQNQLIWKLHAMKGGRVNEDDKFYLQVNQFQFYPRPFCDDENNPHLISHYKRLSSSQLNYKVTAHTTSQLIYKNLQISIFRHFQFSNFHSENSKTAEM